MLQRGKKENIFSRQREQHVPRSLDKEQQDVSTWLPLFTLR